MINDKEFIHHLVKLQKDCEFSLRFLLQKEKSHWRNFFTMLKLVKKRTLCEVTHDYGQHVLSERPLTMQEGLKMVSSLWPPTKNEKGKLSIPGYDEFRVDSGYRWQFVPSKYRHGLLKSDRPMRFLELSVQQDRVGQHSDQELLKEGLPYYPHLGQAIIDFFGLPVDRFSSYGEVYVIVPDYRTQIESLRLLYLKAELKLCSPEIKYENLVLKVFAKSSTKTVTLPDIYPVSELTGFDIGFQPDLLSVALLSRQDNMIIDRKEFSKWIVEEEGVSVERPEEEILSLARAGESQNLEYKHDVIDGKHKNDLVETVVAFLNTNMGVILVGVHDDGEIVGSQKSREDLRKLIHDSCDPPPIEVRIEQRDVAGKSVIVVEVPEGGDKPYQSRRDKNFYVRHGASDMRMERSEMYRILHEKSPSSGF